MMELAPGSAETAEPVEQDSANTSDYTLWRLESLPSQKFSLEIRIRPEVIEGVSRDILQHPEEETSGVLLGRRTTGDHQILWIEGYRKLLKAMELPEPAAVGFYRGTASKQGFPDFDCPPHSLFLAILPEASGELAAQVFLPGDGPAPEPALPLFPFEAGSGTKSQPHAKPRKLVADFDHGSDDVRPAREIFLQPRRVAEETEDDGHGKNVLHRAWPFVAALALIGAAVWLLPRLISPDAPGPPSVDVTASGRPLGLYVDPSFPTWRISWNRDALMLQNARSVRLSIHDGDEVHDGDDQNRVDLSPKDMDSGTYPYQPRTNDVTFRMEATAPNGQVSAESFRLVKSAAVAAASNAPSTALTPGKTGALRAIHRVAPVVAASIRPRIRGKIPIDVRVQVDPRGRVTSATPVSRPRNGVETYLAKSAVQAARGWRFSPALQDGRPVAGTQTLHFVFER